CAGRQGPSVRAADAVDLVVRAEAVDALPVGAVRWRRVAEPQARDDQEGRPRVLQRARAAREPTRGGAPGPAGPRGPAGGRLRRAGGPARRGLAARAAGLGWRSGVLHDPSAPLG